MLYIHNDKYLKNAAPRCIIHMRLSNLCASLLLVIVKCLHCSIMNEQGLTSHDCFQLFHCYISIKVHYGQGLCGPHARPFDHISTATVAVWSCFELTALSLGSVCGCRAARPHGRTGLEWEQISTMLGPSDAARLQSWIMQGRVRARSSWSWWNAGWCRQGGTYVFANFSIHTLKQTRCCCYIAFGALALFGSNNSGNRRRVVRHGVCGWKKRHRL